MFCKPGDYTTYLDNLFMEAAKFLYNSSYSTIGDASSFYTKAVGVSFDGRQEILANLTENTPILLQRDPFNVHDSNAIRIVTNDDRHIGFLNRKIAAVLPHILAEQKKELVYLDDLYLKCS